MTAISTASPTPALQNLSPLTVAHIVRPAQGGMVTHVRTLIDHLDGVRSIVAAPARVLESLGRSGDADDFALPNAGMPQRSFLSWGQKTGLWAQAAQADVLHGHGIRWALLFWTAARKAKKPLVITVHNLLPAMGLLTRATLRFLLSRADYLIAVSAAVAADVRGLLGSNAKVAEIPNGIDMRPFAAKAITDTVNTRADLGVPMGEPIALCVARLSPEKNVGAFVEAAARILATGGDAARAHFLVAGDGPERSALEAQIAARKLTGRVTLLGARPDVPALLLAADVVCLPSRAEGFGLAAVEAMAAGRPVVATRVGGLLEVIVEGETGILVSPDGDAEAFAASLTTLLNDPKRARRMGDAGRERANRLFRAETMAAATRAIYAQVARS